MPAAQVSSVRLQVSETEHKPEPEPAPQTNNGSLFDLLRQSNNAVEEESGTTRVWGEALGARSLLDHVADRPVHKRKVDDLRQVININDKFRFMSDLFHNNMRAYNDFILQLNNIATREEALAYIEQIAQEYKWDLDSLSVKNFYNILDYKF